MDSISNNEIQNSTSYGKNPSKIKFKYEDDDDQVEQDETVTGSSNLEVDEDTSMSDPAAVAVDESMVGGDKTSADYYFDSYSHFGIHEEMLKDVVRTKTYQNVIYKNSFLFKDRVVLDVGAGTGILSLFCAKVGAKHVYAIECSSMADMAQEIVKLNGFSDVITVIKGKVEEIDLPVPQVDIIISEWMGYFLLYENMLDTVLYARDKWLYTCRRESCIVLDGSTTLWVRRFKGEMEMMPQSKRSEQEKVLLVMKYVWNEEEGPCPFPSCDTVKDGLVLPDKASLCLTAIEDADYKEDKIEFWNSVYGFDMSCIRKQAMMEPIVDTVDQNQIVTNCQLLKTMDISKMTSGDASFTAPFKLIAERDDYIHALVAYFDVCFTKCHKLLGFSTGPKSRGTHWKQTVLYLEDVITICQGEAVVGNLTVAPNKKNPRDVDIMLKYSVNGKHCHVSRTQYYRMR